MSNAEDFAEVAAVDVVFEILETGGIAVHACDVADRFHQFQELTTFTTWASLASFEFSRVRNLWIRSVKNGRLPSPRPRP